MNRKTFLFLTAIIFLAVILRFWQLGRVPASPDWDEAALGYNAYSILNTGRDEYGSFLPVILRSFDDYKPALYVYLIIPAIKIFGLTVFAVRLPSAIFGILTVLAAFFLVKELFKREKIALLTSFFLAISPWHIQFSRIAFESNVGLSFNIFFILFFLRGLKKPAYLLLAAFFAGINLYMYQSEKVFIPLLALGFVFIFRKEILEISKKYLVGALVIGFLISLPLINYAIINPEAFARAKGVSVFSDQTLVKNNALKLIEDKKNNDLLGLVLDNRRLVFAKTAIEGYISHFDLNWLFITGDIARHHAPGMGLLYLWELPFLLIGIFCLLFGDFYKKTKLAIFFWFLLTPIPASITSGVPHAVRTLNFLPTFQIFTAIGIIAAATKIKIKYFVLGLSFLFLTFNFLYYLDQYFVQQDYFNSKEWQYGYESAVSRVSQLSKRYDRIIVSNKPYMDQSYIFFLFYLKYSPNLYQKESAGVSGGFREDHRFSKFEFRPIQWAKEDKNPRILYVGMPSDFSNAVRVIDEVRFLDGQTAIRIVEG